jgi:hypothetical protein
MDQFEVYTTETILGASTPTVVIAAGFTFTDEWYAEYFILIPDQECTFYQQHISCNAKKIPKEILEVNLQYMLGEALGQARIQLSTHLQRLYENRGHPQSVMEPSKLLKGDKKQLITLWMRSQCTDEVKHMSENTECRPLKDFLESIQGLPPFEATGSS